MTVFGLVRETIQLRRAFDCDHMWVRVNEREEQCTRCTVIATPEGKESLARMAKSFHGRR